MAASGPLVLSSGVFGQPGRPGANSRVVTGHIGVGLQGRKLLQAAGSNAAAICDVDARRLREAAALAGPRVTRHADYREILDRADIDAVVIATPAHWHAIPALHAFEAGKDVYLEIPACKSLGEARLLRATARTYGAVAQFGAPGVLVPAIAAARAHVAAGKLGAVRRITVWGAPNPQGGDFARCCPPPAELNWDAWLGPAQPRPFHPEIVQGGHHWMQDFGGGQVFLQGAMLFTALLQVLDLSLPDKLRAECTGTAPEPGLRDCPPTMRATFSFGTPERSLVWEQKATPEDAAPCGVTFHGEAGDLTVERGDLLAAARAPGLTPSEASAPSQTALLGHWFDCITTRKAPAVDVGLGCQVATLSMLANLSWRLGRPLTWDAEAGKFENDALADRYISAAGRGEWQP